MNKINFTRIKFCFPEVFHLKLVFQIFVVIMSSLGVPTRFKSSTSTTIISNPVFDFLIKMHGHIEVVHMRPDCFNPYRDRCNLIEHILQGFVLFALGNLNPLGIFRYMSLSINPYR